MFFWFRVTSEVVYRCLKLCVCDVVSWYVCLVVKAAPSSSAAKTCCAAHTLVAVGMLGGAWNYIGLYSHYKAP